MKMKNWFNLLNRCAEPIRKIAFVVALMCFIDSRIREHFIKLYPDHIIKMIIHFFLLNTLIYTLLMLGCFFILFTVHKLNEATK